MPRMHHEVNGAICVDVLARLGFDEADEGLQNLHLLLDRRLIRLKIEREAVRKDEDQSARQRLEKIEAEIAAHHADLSGSYLHRWLCGREAAVFAPRCLRSV